MIMIGRRGARFGAVLFVIVALAAVGRGQSTKHHSQAVVAVVNDEIDRVRKGVDDAKHAAFQGGHYACCIKPSCDWCLLHNNGHCMCAMRAANRSGPCLECHGGWEAGRGRIPAVSRDDVRKMKTFPSADRESSSSPDISPQQAPSSEKNGATAAVSNTNGKAVQLIETKCLSCHTLDGHGSTTAPDLTAEGRRHVEVDWHIRHLKDPQSVTAGSTMPSFRTLGPDDLRTLAEFLVSRK